MSKENLKTYQRLPGYLKEFVVDQNYESYTWREHATWRFIMRQARNYFADHAHEIYQLGIEKTGISISQIPNIEHMDEVLNKFGWGAVCVCGFIPPLAFLDFQANNVLPIAADMRTLEHLSYTPAPDIVHEAAGHAPILVDEAFARFLKRYAKMARKAIFSKEDIRLYEAIRALSDIKENPDSSSEEIKEAELELSHATEAITWISEAAQVTRMYWWTAEYGLVGSMEKPKIYGAGLLSSIEESGNCFKKEIKKIPFSIKCIEQSYDITKPQPQLFVAKDFEQLVLALEELESSMSFIRGGIHAVETGKKSQYMTTTQLDSGICISGELKEYEIHDEQINFIRWGGKVQLAIEGKELPGHGVSRHSHGFSLALGHWKCCPEKDPTTLTENELSKCGIIVGQRCSLAFVNGFEIEGFVKEFQSFDGKLQIIVWQDCTVLRDKTIYFEPSWGEYDQVIGLKVESVFGGPADWESFGDYNMGRASTVPSRKSSYTQDELDLFKLYHEVRVLREQKSNLDNDEKDNISRRLGEIGEILSNKYPNDWVLGIELIEIIYQILNDTPSNHLWTDELKKNLLNEKNHPKWVGPFIKKGINLANIHD